MFHSSTAVHSRLVLSCHHILKFRVCLQCSEERTSSLSWDGSLRNCEHFISWWLHNMEAVLKWKAICFVSDVVWGGCPSALYSVSAAPAVVVWDDGDSIRVQAGRNTEPCCVAAVSWLQSTDKHCVAVSLIVSRHNGLFCEAVNILIQACKLLKKRLLAKTSYFWIILSLLTWTPYTLENS